MIFHHEIQHGLLLERSTGPEQTGVEVLPSAGIYYVVPMNKGWLVMACRYTDVAEEIDHSKFWERYVCRAMADYWAVKLAHPRNKLRKLLEEHPYGFPRGRVTDHGAKYDVFHGLDNPNASRVTRGEIEAIFGIKGKAIWVRDDHERCLLADKMAVREIMSLADEWPAV